MIIDNCTIAGNVPMPDVAAMNMTNGSSHYCIMLDDRFELCWDGKEASYLYLVKECIIFIFTFPRFKTLVKNIYNIKCCLKIMFKV